MQLEVISRTPASNARPTPLLFVHGAWHAAWCWDEHFLPYFAEQGYAVHALSLRGHGGSEGHERLRWWSVADYVEDVKQVVDSLGKPPVLIGHSMGGYVVQKYVERYFAPAAVLLASIPARTLIPAFARAARRSPLAFLKNALTLTPYHLIGTPQLTRESFFSEDMPQEQVEAYFARMQNESFRVLALEATLLNLANTALIREHSTPILVLGAENDTIFTIDEEEATARAYGTRGEYFPNMAHDMMLETGWQGVAKRVLTWLEARKL